MKASTISFDELLENTSVTKDAFLLGMQPFCKTPILFYFALRQKFEETIKKELIFHPNRADTFNKKPHRGFTFVHPTMGELFCYIFHVTKDWFNVALIKPKPNNIEAPTLEGQTLVAVSFWTLNGVDTMRVNSSHFKFHSGSEGSIFENQQGAYLNNLKKHFNFCLEMIGMLEECG